MTNDESDESFRRVYDLLAELTAAVDHVRRVHAGVVSGPELITLTAIVGEEAVLDANVHRLEKQVRAHQVS